MSKNGVNIKLLDTTLGLPVVNDNVAMLVFPTATSDPLLTTPVLISSVDDIKTKAIPTTGWDTNAMWNITEFYKKAGTGAKLWLFGYEKSQKMSVVVASDALKKAVRLTTQTLWDNRPRLIGFIQVSTATIPASGLDSDLTKAGGAIEGAQTFVKSMFADSYRMTVVLDAGRIAEDYTTLPDGATYASYAVALSITTSDPTKTSNVGRALGKLASIALGESIGNPNYGSDGTTDYLVNGLTTTTATNVAIISRSEINDIGVKQYLFTRTRAGLSGIYYNDGSTLNDSTKALSKIEFVRIANAVCDDAERYFQLLLNTQIPVNSSGNIDDAYKASVLADYRSKFIEPRVASGQISNMRITLDAKDGNYVQTKSVEVKIAILPAPNLEWVDIDVFYVSEL